MQVAYSDRPRLRALADRAGPLGKRAGTASALPADQASGLLTLCPSRHRDRGRPVVEPFVLAEEALVYLPDEGGLLVGGDGVGFGGVEGFFPPRRGGVDLIRVPAADRAT